MKAGVAKAGPARPMLMKSNCVVLAGDELIAKEKTMNKKTYLLPFVWVFLLASPALAGVEWVKGAVCPNECRKFEIPFLQGDTEAYTLIGPGVGKVNRVEGLASGMSSTLIGVPWGPLVDNDRKVLTLTIAANATPGKRTLKLFEIGKDLFGNPIKNQYDVLDIYVVRAGTFSAPDIWPMPNYFNETTLIVAGQKFANAAVELAGWPQGTYASIVSPIPPPNDNVAQIRIRFPTRLAEASGDILLSDRGMPTVCKNLIGTYGYKVTGTNTIRKRVTIQGPNAVKSIGFIDGPAYASGETITIRLTFNRPIGPQGAVIFWRLGPNSGNVTAQAIAPTPYDPNAEFNQRTVNAGATSVDLRIRVCGCPGGVWSVPVSTWFGSTENATAPGFKGGSFSVSCPAGGVACP